jgi:hypothetical protein
VTKKIKVIAMNLLVTALIIMFMAMNVLAKEPKAKFYDFSEQIINGELRRPMNLYTDARERVKFERLLKLKKSFINELYNSAKEKIFK